MIFASVKPVSKEWENEHENLRRGFRRVRIGRVKTPVSFVISARPCPHVSARLLLDGYSRNLISKRLLRKSVEEVQIWLKSDKKFGHFA